MPRRQYDFRSGELADEDQVLPEPGRVLPFHSRRRGEGWALYREARRQLREYNAARRGYRHNAPTNTPEPNEPQRP